MEGRTDIKREEYACAPKERGTSAFQMLLKVVIALDLKRREGALKCEIDYNNLSRFFDRGERLTINSISWASGLVVGQSNRSKVRNHLPI